MTRRFVLACLISLLVVAGCSVKPGNLQITPRDQEVYRDPQGTPLAQSQETKHTVAILVTQGKGAREQTVYRSLDAALTESVSGMAFFSLVERSNLAALAKEQSLESLNDDQLGKLDVGKADYLITAKVASASLAPAALSTRAFQGKVQVDYRFYEKASNRVILTKSLTGLSPSTIRVQENQDPAPLVNGEPGTAKLVEAVQETAKAFATELAARYAPTARVTETRGEGQVARITVGSNYGLTQGAKVQFYEYADNSDIVAGASREPRIIGYGKVIEIDDKCAWAEVDDFKKIKVLRGHYVKVAFDQSKSSGEALGDSVKAIFK